MIFNGHPLGSVAGQVFDKDGSLLPVKQATITTSSSGATQIVAAVTGKRIHVLSGSIAAAGTTTVKLTSGSSGMELTGAKSLIANSVVPIIETRTNPGEGLFITNSAAVEIDVEVAYVESSVGWESDFDARKYGVVAFGFDLNSAASRNAGAGSVGDTMTSVDPKTTTHTTSASYKLTLISGGSSMKFEQGAYGVMLNARNDTTTLTMLNANGGRTLWKNLAGGSFIGVFEPKSLSGVNVLISIYTNAATDRFLFRINSDYSVRLITRRADADSASSTDSAAGVLPPNSPAVIIISLDYTNNQGNVYINGTRVITNCTISSSGGGTLANTNSSYDSNVFGSGSAFNGAEGHVYYGALLNAAVSTTQAASITNHIRYLRGF